MVIVVCPWKESLTSDGQQFHQYQYNEQSPLTEHTNRPRLMTLKKKSLVWDRHTIVAGVSEQLFIKRMIVHRNDYDWNQYLLLINHLWSVSYRSKYRSYVFVLHIVVCPFLWPLCFCLFFDMRTLITPLVSSNISLTRIRWKGESLADCIPHLYQSLKR
jgi:hypothetical protein